MFPETNVDPLTNSSSVLFRKKKFSQIILGVCHAEEE